jgi:DNA mismatch repair protein MutS
MSKKQTPLKIETDANIHDDYLQYTKEYQEKYGTHVIVLLQVGAFFEVYGIKNPETGILSGSHINEFSEICQLNISEKKVSHKTGQIMMAGFRDYQLDKYLPKLTDAGYTIPVYIQEKQGKEIQRKLDRIYSTGTYLTGDTDSSPIITNNIMCIWIELHNSVSEKIRPTIVYGVSVVNIFTGKSSMFQYETPFYMNTTTFDELERYVSVYSPSEVLILSPFEKEDLKTFIKFVGIQSPRIHRIDCRDKENKKVVNCANQKYIKQILSTFFDEELFNQCSEFQTQINATQAFCFLLNFIQEHNPDLIRKIATPDFNNTSYRVILANHTLSQLNIIGDMSQDSQKSGHLSSVLSLLNKCCSAMGKRKFQDQLTNPTFDEAWLTKEYKMISTMLSENHVFFIDVFRKQLTQMRDLEKISRQLILRRLYPSSLYHLYKSVQIIHQINTCLCESPAITSYLCDDFLDPASTSGFDDIQDKTTQLLQFFDNCLYIEKCKTISSMTYFEENIFQPGISEELDATIARYVKCETQFYKIQKFFNDLMQKKENNYDTEYVKKHDTEKSGSSLQLTTKRAATLKNLLADLASKHKNGIFELDSDLHLPLNEITFPKASGSSSEIDFPLFHDICKNMILYKDQMNNCIVKAYLEFLEKLESLSFTTLENFSKYIAKLDVLQTKAYVANENHYCAPTIVSSAPKSFVDAKELRHCLIEHLQQNEIYVTNDIVLGASEAKDGVLLYGTNAVGKTSFIRALGVCVIMAQAGMFVPCTEFHYKPYTAIYSRILGNDNLFKGLSTFAVEMSELRIILKMADSCSLILGDELCSGTETESALSIFVAGLMNLNKKEASYIFATHFHEIVEYEEIQALDRLCMKHMTVHYEPENDCLVYDRKLKSGSGPRIYGLEVCKSLYLGDEFLETAYGIRNKYFPSSRGELSHPITTYNSKKIRGRCEVCKENMGEEIHHLQPQQIADESGFIGTFHKNHPANLVAVCESCHKKFHDKGTETPVMTKKRTTKGYSIQKLSPL